MRFLTILSIGLLQASFAYADDFGARFANEAPAALEETSEMDLMAEGLQDVMPAAGEEVSETSEEPKENTDTASENKEIPTDVQP